MNIELIAYINGSVDIILVSILSLFLLIAVPFFIVSLFSSHFKGTWYCDKMGWHLPPGTVGFDGCSQTGQCPRCHKDIMQDSQGNWF